MKQIVILFFCLFSLSLVSCSDAELAPAINLDSSSSSVVDLSYKPGVSVSIPFTSTADWTVECNNTKEVSITPTSGKAGKQSLTVKLLTANQTSKDRSFTLSIKTIDTTSAASQSVTLRQPPVFVLNQTAFTVNPDGGVVDIAFETPLPEEELRYIYDEDFAEMWKRESEESRSTDRPIRADYRRWGITFNIQPNETGKVREGHLMLCDTHITLANTNDPTNLMSEVITITQDSKENDSSTDFSADGQVFTLQTHTKGTQGVPIVLMGDAFIDKDIADGIYEEVMKDAAERLFTIEPMASLREYFDIYMVNAISEDNTVSASSHTIFSSEFHPNTTEITGDDDKCMEYALKAIDEKRKHDALVLVIINDTRYAGTCSLMATSATKNGVPNGVSIAYIPTSKERYEIILLHEAVGHGLGKLADEYGTEDNYKPNGSILEDESALGNLKQFQQYFALLNVTLESDVLQTPWSKFYQDERYAAEELGCYEGADTYPYGIYRPTDNSLMRSGEELNVVGRNLIYKRVMNIAYDYEWDYDYEEFVKFDTPARNATRVNRSIPAPRFPKQHAKPRLILQP